jgi:hypothetical protein
MIDDEQLFYIYNVNPDYDINSQINLNAIVLKC